MLSNNNIVFNKLNTMFKKTYICDYDDSFYNDLITYLNVLTQQLS